MFGCRREYPPQITPKMFLLEWSRKEKLEQPQYETVRKRKASYPQKCSPSFLNVTAWMTCGALRGVCVCVCFRCSVLRTEPFSPQ